MALGKLGMNKRLAEKNVKLIKAKGVDTLLLSMILGVDLQTKNRNELDNKGRVLILSTMGFIGNTNTKLAPFRAEITKNKNILIADKYTLKAEEITQRGADGKVTSSPFWKKISVKAESMSTIIITNFSPLVNTKPLPKDELDAKYRSSIKLLIMYADLYKKNIIIIEDEDYSIEVLSKEIEPKNIFEVNLENNNLFIKESANGDKILIKSNALENITKGEDRPSIQDIIYTKKRVTLDAISSGSIRSLPSCPTGFYELDQVLGGGLELGQLVSFISENEEFSTHFTLQMALQLPAYYKSLIINLSMNPRRFKEMLDHKNKNNQDKVQALTVDRLQNDGEIKEIIEAIRYYFENEDTRVFIIDNDSLISDTSKNFSDPQRETDSIYKKLQMVANKLDVLVIILSQSLKEIGSDSVVKIDNSIKAVEYAKTQIAITSDIKLFVTKQLSSVKNTMKRRENLLSSDNNSSRVKFLSEKIDNAIQENSTREEN